MYSTVNGAVKAIIGNKLDLVREKTLGFIIQTLITYAVHLRSLVETSAASCLIETSRAITSPYRLALPNVEPAQTHSYFIKG